ncbi:MAG TPA: DUF63 family protein [Candidatus Altiarchaeales archaeon]|nr:DUF63 family protein [Candidatus Altiarchaeales archaeon]
MILQKAYDFFYKYYVVPGYDWVDTLTYGLILAFTVFYLLPKLKNLGFEIDKKFCISILPYILFGATLRELVDRGFGWYAGHSTYPQNFYFVSPTIYLTMFLITLAALLASFVLAKVLKRQYQYFFAGIGSALAFYNIALAAGNISRPETIFLVAGSMAVSLILTYGLVRRCKFDFVYREWNYTILLAHLFDASTTFVGLDFRGLVEQHVVPNLFINWLGTAAVMYPLKLLVILPALYYVDLELPGEEEKFKRRLLKIVLVVLGAGPGIRNMTLLVLG